MLKKRETGRPGLEHTPSCPDVGVMEHQYTRTTRGDYDEIGWTSLVDVPPLMADTIRVKYRTHKKTSTSRAYKAEVRRSFATAVKENDSMVGIRKASTRAKQHLI